MIDDATSTPRSFAGLAERLRGGLRTEEPIAAGSAPATSGPTLSPSLRDTATRFLRQPVGRDGGAEGAGTDLGAAVAAANRPTVESAPAGGTAPVAPVDDPRTEEQVLEDAIALLRTSPTGVALLDRVLAAGVEIEISEDASFAHFNQDAGEHGKVVINPSVFTATDRVAGVLGHELGHALLHHSGVEAQLDALPDGIGHLADEVVSEALSSAIAREAGFERGESSISYGDGRIRRPAQGLDSILESDFYVDHYGIDRSAITDRDLQTSYDAVTGATIRLIEALGGTPPDEYLVGVTRTPNPFGGPDYFGYEAPTIKHTSSERPRGASRNP